MSLFAEPTAHTQVQASQAIVDEGIAPLLEKLWERNYLTEFSCQGGEPSSTEFAYIMFTLFVEALLFVREALIKLPKRESHRIMFESWDSGRARVTWPHTLTPMLIEVF